jgi:hypothetical protein
VLAQENNSALSLPRWHAVINHESGVAHGNEVAHIPDSSSRGTFDELQRTLWARMDSATPRLFDGSHQPELARAADFAAPRGPVLGQIIDVDDRSAMFRLEPVPGRNLAVIGTATADALSVLESAALSLGVLYKGHPCEFHLWCPVKSLEDRAAAVAERLRRTGHEVSVRMGDDVGKITEDIAELAGETAPTHRFVFFYAVDAAAHLLEVKESPLAKSGFDKLRELLKNGPARHVHTFGWWRGVGRFKETLGFGGMDDIGGWVALDVQGAELNTLAAGQVVDWSPRPHRAVFFDRTTHSRPDVLIPFDTTSALEQP